MQLVRRTPRFGGLSDLYTFECRACGVWHIEEADALEGRPADQGRFHPEHRIWGPFWAEPRHLGKQVGRALIAHQKPISTEEIAQWAYPGAKRERWHWQNVWRHMRAWGYQPVGRTRHNGCLWAPHNAGLVRPSVKAVSKSGRKPILESCASGKNEESWMPSVEAKCPVCGLRVDLSEREQRLIDASSRCTHPDGWWSCPNLKPILSKARSELR